MRLHVAIALTIAAALSTTPAQGQVLFHEGFESQGVVPIGGWGPQGLINAGWIFDNNSSPLGFQAWFPGCCWGAVISPLEGQGYLAASQDTTAGSGQYSAWAVMPQVTGQQAGDILTFYTISSDTSSFDNAQLQVRYSPTGGTVTGSAPSDVGSFTQILLDIGTIPNFNEGLADGWTAWEVTLPGPGRIAFRQAGLDSLYFGIEEVTVSRPPVNTGAYPEDFEDLDGVCGEGACALASEGWIFRDQSVPQSSPAWEPNMAGDTVEAHDGFGFLKSVSAAGGGSSSGGVNNWAILPDQGLDSGDVLSFFATGILAIDDEVGVLEVRYSPSGGTSTGSGVNGVGDFTQVLLTLTDLVYGSWQPATVTIPGNGRVAIRFHNPTIPLFSGARIAAIDTLAVNGAPLGPPLPLPGQTVAWTPAMSPITIDADLAVSAGGTLIIQPGVTVNHTSGHTLSVGGTLLVQGTAANRVTINGYAPDFPTLEIAEGGHTEFTFATLNDGRFEGTFATSCLVNDGILDARKVVACQFDQADVSVVDDVLAVFNSSFVNGGISLLRGYFHAENVNIQGSAIALSRQHAAHTVHLDTLSITGAPGPALNLSGWSFNLGPNNQISGNGSPAQLRGGLWPGSVVPPTGNILNFVRLQDDENFTGFDELPAIAVPYLLSGLYVTGFGLEVLPGARIVGAPGSNLWEQFGVMRLVGLPDQPIMFEGQGGAGSWNGVQWSLANGSRAEYCVVEGGIL